MSMAEIAPAVAEEAAARPVQKQRRFTFSVGIGPRLVTSSDILQEIPLGASLQALPNMPPALAGAVNVRGAIRVVFDPLGAMGVNPAQRPAQRRILLLDRDTACAGTLILGEPRLDELLPAAGVAASGPFAAVTRAVWTTSTDETVLEIDHRAWFCQLRDLNHS